MASAAYVGSVNRRGEYAGLGQQRDGFGVGDAGGGERDGGRSRRPEGAYLLQPEHRGVELPRAAAEGAAAVLGRAADAAVVHVVEVDGQRIERVVRVRRTGPGGSSAAQNYHDPDSNRSVSSYNIPHFLSFYSVYELPMGTGQAGT